MSTPESDDLDEIMCDCTGTTRADIKKLFIDGRDIDGISSKTGATTGCGGCEWDIEEYLDVLNAANTKDE